MGDYAASDLHLVTSGNFRRIDARLPLVHWHMVFEHLAWLNLNHQVVFIQRSAFQCTVRYPIRPYPGLSGHFFFVLERRWEGDTGDVLEDDGLQGKPISSSRGSEVWTPMQLDQRVRYRPK